MCRWLGYNERTSEPLGNLQGTPLSAYTIAPRAIAKLRALHKEIGDCLERHDA